MSETPANDPRSGDFAAPLGSLASGRLRFLRGASDVIVHADYSTGDLYHSHFGGVAPEVWTEGGVVNIRYPRFFHPFGRRGCSGKVALNAAIPWHFEVRDGASIRFGDESVGEEALDDAVEIPGLEGDEAVGAVGDGLHEPVAVQLVLGECEEELEVDGLEREEGANVRGHGP